MAAMSVRLLPLHAGRRISAVQYILAALAGSWALALALDFGAQVVGLSAATRADILTAWVTAGVAVALVLLGVRL